MKADFHIRSFEHDLIEGPQFVFGCQSAKYQIKLNEADPIKPHEMILAFKVLHNGKLDSAVLPKWIYVDEIIQLESNHTRVAVQFDNHHKEIEHAKLPAEDISAELASLLTLEKFQPLNCVTANLCHAPGYELSHELSQALLDFYQESHPNIEDYDLVDDLKKNGAIKTDAGWQLTIGGHTLNFAPKVLDENSNPKGITELRARYQDAPISYLNLCRRNCDLSGDRYADLDDNTLVNQCENIEMLREYSQMMIRSGSIELFVMALRQPHSELAWVATLELVAECA